MKNALLTVFLVALACFQQALWATHDAKNGQSVSVDSCALSLKAEKNHLAWKIRSDYFNVTRGLSDYHEMLPGFSRALNSLNQYDHWIDSGAGIGLASTEYLLARSHVMNPAKVTAVTAGTERVMNEEALATIQSRFNYNYFSGRFIESIPDETIGTADLITDLYGPATYTDDLDALMDKHLNLLNQGGQLFTLTSASRTKFVDSQGREMHICEVLALTKGAELVSCEPNGTAWVVMRFVRRSMRPVVTPPMSLMSIENTKGPIPMRRFLVETDF